MRDILESTLERLLTDLVTPALLRECETGAWPASLAAALEDSGFALAAVSEDQGGAAAGWEDLHGVVRLAGRHALPLPLPETMLANHLLERCGLPVRNAMLSIAAQADLRLRDGRVSGRLVDVPWGAQVQGVLAIVQGAEPALVLLDPRRARIQTKKNVAGEPRDDLVFDESDAVAPLAAAPLPHPLGADLLWLGGAMLRSAQTAGALEAALALSVQYATQRVQFGKPIAAFQAIQHQLAVMAEHMGCVRVAAEAAFAESAQAPSPLAIACAKVVAAEGAGAVAAMAHTVHGAIGFTHEHALQHLTRRLWSWRSEFGNLGHWSTRLGAAICVGGASALWPAVTSGRLSLPATLQEAA